LYQCSIWYLVSSLSLGECSVHPEDEHKCPKHVEEYNRCHKEFVHQVGKKDYYCTRMQSQQNIKKKNPGN